MHGGPIRQMLLGYHYSEYYANAYVMNQYLASQGYVVMSVNYRAGTGYGKAFRRAPDQGPRGASEYQDIVAAAKYVQGLSYVDADKIRSLGWKLRWLAYRPGFSQKFGSIQGWGGFSWSARLELACDRLFEGWLLGHY